MQSILRWFTRVTAFRIGLATGLLFAALHLWEVARRDELPFVYKLESALKDFKFFQRQRVVTPPRVAIAAVDEKAIARYGRFPWDRHVLAQLVDKLGEDESAAVGFDMSFSDEDLSGAFAGADRFRSRFEQISLAAGNGKQAVERFGEAESDIAGGTSALEALSTRLKPGAEPVFETAKGRFEDGRQKLKESKEQLDALVKEHAEYAGELQKSVTGLNADRAFADSIRRNGKAIVGWIALTPAQVDAFTPKQMDEQAALLSAAYLATPEYRQVEGGAERAEPIERTIAGVKHYFGARAPLPIIAQGAPGFGFFNTVPDYDGVIRSVMLVMEMRGHYLPSLELATVARVLGVPPGRIVPVTSDDTDGLLAGIDVGGKLFIPTDERGLLRINYYGKDKTDRGSATVDRVIPQYSIADILADKIPPGVLKDKAVLIAATAEGTFDQRVTPFERIAPGVQVHAHAIQTILDGRFIRPGNGIQAAEILSCVLLAFVFAWFFAKVRVSMALPLVLLSIVGVHYASYAFFLLGYEVFEAMPLMEMAGMFVLVTVFRYATEERDKRQLRKAFQLYLNPDVMEEMLNQPDKLQLGGDEKEMTVLFSDIRGFTTISEKLSPQALVHLLNDYLTPMTDIVFARRGTLDKYIGDAVMAFYGAPIDNPAHALHACESALEMMETLGRLRERWRIEDPSIPDLDIGIGINSGPMVVGNMGSLQRFNYTVMGDNVNLASRLEGLNKEYATHILISEATLLSARKAAGSESALAVRELDFVAVKGKKEPVRLFELRGLGRLAEHDRPLCDTYENGLRLYRAQKFAEAKNEFETCLTLQPSDGPSLLFAARCDKMMASPPGADWNGVFKMEHK